MEASECLPAYNITVKKLRSRGLLVVLQYLLFSTEKIYFRSLKLS